MAKVTFDAAACKGCGLCVKACPTKIIKLSDTHINEKGYYTAEVTDIGRCVACASCAIMCPDCVITVEK